jgi:glycerol uptake facilitator-like aquaporin
MNTKPLLRRLTAEFVGSSFLLMTVVGSGIMGERLSGGNLALALLGNTIPTGAILIVLILIMGPISGAHFNPIVSLCFAFRKELNTIELISYIAAQMVGSIVGVLLAHGMFDLELIQLSETTRAGGAQFLSEIIASAGLILTIFGCIKSAPNAVSYAVGLYITAAYWFTASTSFANPAVTIARSITNTFSGISPNDIIAFIIAQLIGGLIGISISKLFETLDGEKQNVSMKY